ncbi:MAG: hypothetical protein J6T25_01215 [Bacilli bacterium]|nr:hypothetical protein [Bacilli bacterium]
MNEQAVSILLAIICILFSLSLIGFLVGRYIYRRKHNLPTGDCECCCISTKKILKKYHKSKKL